ncbi:unnamed protein product [Phyllotreta striolata]|uniref:Large ribosomal subunit protein mL46 n=1 Tax=Phyllotreta striolata TaxID=444603 RepID=A0A9N9XTX4_PHYSR|nr:unnamed protein product [Phyllotreta striolata]
MFKLNCLLLQRCSNNVKYAIAIRKESGTVSKEKWDIFAAVCLERKPVITPKLNELEKEYEELSKTIEFERSVKSDFELRHESEVKNLEILKKGGELDVEGMLKQTAQDLKDSWSSEARQFQPADRITDADKKNDGKSLKRKLDKHLVFVTNQTIGKDKFYLLPQGSRQDGETLRQTAERVLKSIVGDELKAQIYSNAPIGFYKYKYPLEVRKENNVVGAKVFIYFARYLKGQLPQKLDYKWLDRMELDKTLPTPYKNSVQQFLIDE